MESLEGGRLDSALRLDGGTNDSRDVAAGRGGVLADDVEVDVDRRGRGGVRLRSGLGDHVGEEVRLVRRELLIGDGSTASPTPPPQTSGQVQRRASQGHSPTDGRGVADQRRGEGRAGGEEESESSSRLEHCDGCEGECKLWRLTLTNREKTVSLLFSSDPYTSYILNRTAGSDRAMSVEIKCPPA